MRVADRIGVGTRRELLPTELPQRLQHAVARQAPLDVATNDAIDLSTSTPSSTATSRSSIPLPAHTRSARSRHEGAPCTEHREPRSKSSCSSAVSRSYDHATRSRSVRCRGSVARREPASTRKRSGSSSASCSALIDRMRAAASSIARGTPSSRMHSSAMAAQFDSSSSNPACAEPARSTNSCTAATSASSSSGRSTRAGTGRGGTDQTNSAGMPSGSRLVARTCTSGHHCSTCSTSSLVVSSTCSQLSSTSSTDCDANSSTIDSSRVRPGRCCTSSAAANAAATAPSSRTGASSINRTPSENWSAMVAGEAVRRGCSCPRRRGRTT